MYRKTEGTMYRKTSRVDCSENGTKVDFTGNRKNARLFRKQERRLTIQETGSISLIKETGRK